MSLHLVKSLSRPLSLISAALLLHIGGAVAADAAGDVQQHMREVLAGGAVIRSVPPSEPRDDTAGRPAADAQELAKRLLLGVTDSRIQVAITNILPGSPARRLSLAAIAGAWVGLATGLGAAGALVFSPNHPVPLVGVLFAAPLLIVGCLSSVRSRSSIRACAPP